MRDEPVRGALPEAAFHSLSGLDRLRAWEHGLAPRVPLSHLAGHILTHVDAASLGGAMPASPWLQHIDGSLEVRTFIGTAVECAALAVTPPGSVARMTALSVNRLYAARVSSHRITGRAHVMRSDAIATLVEVELEDAHGRRVTHAVGSAVIEALDPPPPPLRGPLQPVARATYTDPDPYLRPAPDFHLPETEPGLSIVRSIAAGELALPPICQLLGIRVVGAEEGTVTLTMPCSRWLCSTYEEVGGGVIAALANLALNGAFSSICGTGQRGRDIGQHIGFLAPVVPDGRDLIARGNVRYRRDRAVVTAAEVTDADGRPIASAQQSTLVVVSTPREPRPHRVLATVLFSDIVDSTRRAQELGDNRWCELLARHDELVRLELSRNGGREVKHIGDGFLATFDSPARAVECARTLRDRVKGLGVDLRIGIHTGECEVVGLDVAGIAVHLASRIQVAARPGEVLVSGTVADLVAGSGIRFTDRGLHELKGVEGMRQLFAVAG